VQRLPVQVPGKGGMGMQPLPDELIAKYQALTSAGRLASYIPELSNADKEALAVVVADTAGIKASGRRYACWLHTTKRV